MEIQGLKGH